MKPSLPTRPTRDPDKISAGWLCRLLDCVEWAMEHPRGDGNTLLNTYGGILRANIKPTSSASSTTMASAPACPAKVVGKQGPFYLVDLHENGTEAMPTRRNVLLYVLDLNMSEELAGGTWLLAVGTHMRTLGGGNVL